MSKFYKSAQPTNAPNSNEQLGRGFSPIEKQMLPGYSNTASQSFADLHNAAYRSDPKIVLEMIMPKPTAPAEQPTSSPEAPVVPLDAYRNQVNEAYDGRAVA